MFIRCIVLCVFFLLVTQGNEALRIRPKTCTCGVDIKIRPRIIGGTAAQEAEFPWNVAIYYKNKVECGGSILNDRYILTAAHCLKMPPKKPWEEERVLELKDIKFVIGSHRLEEESKNSNFTILERTPVEFIIHPDFNLETFTNDIALARLNEPISTYAFNILPVCLPPPNFKFENIKAVVSGWGAEKENQGPTNILKKTSLRVLPNSICANKLQNNFEPETMLCAATPGHDACQGDSGGPLVSTLGTLTNYQIGVVSFGIGCGNYKYPGAYTRLNKYLWWIYNNTQDAFYCKNQRYT